MDQRLREYATDAQWEAMCEVEEHGGDRAAERATGKSNSYYSRVRAAVMAKAARHGYAPDDRMQHVALPTFPASEDDPERILDHMARQFQIRRRAADARKWFSIDVHHSEPIGVNWFGDPHIGSNGCNVPLLRRDIDIVRSTPGMYAANLGDTTDNWSGKLLRLYAENDVSKSTERSLARWFLQDAGIPWLFWLEGNHDSMDGAFLAHLRAINANKIPMIDWRAQFCLRFANGQTFRIDAAHNHKGQSQFHELHGQIKAGLFDEDADLYIAGHHHNCALMQRSTVKGVVWYARARGYKWLDDHARHHQFPELQEGASIVSVFDPRAEAGPRRMKVFMDAAEGAEFLTWLRAR